MPDFSTFEDKTGYPIPGYFLSTSFRNETTEGGGSYKSSPGAYFRTQANKITRSNSFEQVNPWGSSSTGSGRTTFSSSSSATYRVTTLVGTPPNTTVQSITKTGTGSGSSSSTASGSITRNITGVTNSYSSTTFDFYNGWWETTPSTGNLEYYAATNTSETLSISYSKISESFNNTTSQLRYTTLKNAPYDIIISTKQASQKVTVTDLTSSQYTTSSTIPTYYDTTNTPVTCISNTFKSSKYSGSNTWIPNTVVIVQRNNAWGGQLLVWDGDKSGEFSKCFKRVSNNMYTLSGFITTKFESVATYGSDPAVARTTTKFEPPPPAGLIGVNFTSNSNLYASYVDLFNNSTRSSALWMAWNYSSSVYYLDRTTTKADQANKVFDLKVSRLSSTKETTFLNFTVNTTTSIADNSLTTESRQISFSRLYTTKEFQIKQSYATTAKYNVSLEYEEGEDYSRSTAQTFSSSKKIDDKVFETVEGGSATTNVKESITASRLVSSFKVPINLRDMLDVRSQYAFTCLKAPSGFIGFAGTFDYSKISSSNAYRSIKSNKNGAVPWRGAIDFNLFDLNTNLFALVREDGTVIIPQTYQEFPDYSFTVSAVAPKKLQTSVELTVFYSTTSNTTASSNSSSSSIYSYSGITKTRGSGLEFTTGSTRQSQTYSIFTSTVTTSTTRIDTAVTYRYSLTNKVNGTKYFTSGVVSTSVYSLHPNAATCGTIGGGNMEDTVLSIGPVFLKYTLDDTDGKSQSGKKSMTNISKENMLTIKEGSFMYFEAHPLYTTVDYGGYNNRWFAADEYYFE